jgi:cell pole-organizing protein PopZ
MNVVEKNGQPSMEEILASIRRIIAEEPNGSSPVIDIKAKTKPVLVTSLIDEQPDFELPAIFRPNAQLTEKHTPLFGRLTDAIRNASNGTAEIRTTKPVEIEAAEDLEAVPHAKLNGHNHRNGTDGYGGLPEPALSQLNLARDEAMAAHAYVNPHADPQAGHLNDQAQLHVEDAAGAAGNEGHSIRGAVSEWWNGAASSSAKLAAPVEDVKRVMVPFRDMRMSKMGSCSTSAPLSVPPPAPAEPATPEARALPEHANTVFVHMDVPDAFQSEYVPPLDPRDLAVVPAVPPLPEQGPRAAGYGEASPHNVATQHFGEPPALPHQPAHPVAGAASAVEDATADLLRPMLRQWLAENMPRMVEKALHIELAASVKSGKKPGAL